MKKEIYIEIIDLLENYSDFKDSDILYALHENIHVFDKNAIEGNLKALMEEVLLELYLPSSYKSKNIKFNMRLDLSLAGTIAEYLEFRYDFDYVFHQKMRYLKQTDFHLIEDHSIKDFTILKNCFFDSQSFYFYGRIDSFVNREGVQGGSIKNQFRIRGIEGGKINVFNTLIGFNDTDSIQQVVDDKLCLFYGTVSFNPELMENVITTNRIYNLEILNEWS